MTVQRPISPRRPSQNLSQPSRTAAAWRRCRISARCLTVWALCAAFSFATLAAGPASAQSEETTTPFAIAATPDEQTLTVGGGSAIFHLTVTNGADGVLARDLVLSAEQLPVDWLYSAEPRSLKLQPGQTGNATLTITPGPNATAGGPHDILVLASQNASAVASASNASTTVRVTLVEPSEPPQPNDPEPVRLSISARDASGRPGTSVAGSLALLSDDERPLNVELDVIGPASWSPDLSLSTRVLYPGQGVQYVSLYATVPPTLVNGTTQDFTVTARTLGETFTTVWTVTVLGEPVTSGPDGDTTDPAGTDATGDEGSVSTNPSPTAPTQSTLPGLRVDIQQRAVDVRLGETGANTVIVDNTGGTPLTVRLEGSAHATWGAFEFVQDTLELAPGAREYVDFTWDVPEDIVALPLSGVRVTARDASDPAFFVTTAFDITLLDALIADAPPAADDTTPAATLGADSPTIALPATWGVAAGMGAVGVGALALARRPWREKFLWGAAGLYTRLARPDVLGHDERERLYRIIEESPGTHFHALQRQLGWNTGTLTYHLRVLERHGFVVSRRDGLYRRFYLQGAAPRKETFTDGPTGLRADVLEAIRNQHGMSQADLALALGANKQTVNYHVKALERAGTIRVEKRGRETFLYPTTPDTLGANDTARA